jgi:hypothetical protein
LRSTTSRAVRLLAQFPTFIEDGSVSLSIFRACRSIHEHDHPDLFVDIREHHHQVMG